MGQEFGSRRRLQKDRVRRGQPAKLLTHETLSDSICAIVLLGDEDSLSWVMGVTEKASAGRLERGVSV